MQWYVCKSPGASLSCWIVNYTFWDTMNHIFEKAYSEMVMSAYGYFVS